jgi:hypothetical protein
MTDTDASKAGAAARAMILPLALAQFIASYEHERGDQRDRH